MSELVNQYDITFINEAKQNGYLSNKEVLDIQIEIMELLKDVVAQYTKGGSSNIRIDIAENLLRSIYYTLSFAFDSNNVSKLNLLKTKSINDLYYDGLNKITKTYENTKISYEKLLKTKILVDNEMYNTSIESISDFFKNYNYIFNAHDTPCDIDYPVTFCNMDLEGINYIKQYVDMLILENEFVQIFDKGEVLEILNIFALVSRLDIKKSPYNIFEIVLNNAVFSSIVNRSENLIIERNDYKIIESKLLNSKKNKQELDYTIDESFKKVISLINNNEKLISYINKYKSIFKERLFNILNNGLLKSMLLIEDENDLSLKLKLSKGKKMNNEIFKFFIENLIKEKDINKKIELFFSTIKSYDDFIDTLKSNSFFEDEHIEIFKRLSYMELALLINHIYYDDFNNGEVSINNFINTNFYSLNEWEKYFINFLKNLKLEDINNIELELKKY
jgi:hypothetical protein